MLSITTKPDLVPVQVKGDWRAFRAQLVALERLSSAGGAAALLAPSARRWAHEIAQPEKGCLLVAKRSDLGMFASAVILMLEHGMLAYCRCSVGRLRDCGL